MPLPVQTNDAYRKADILPPGDGWVACEGSKFHSPTPMVTKPYWMSGAVEYALDGTHAKKIGDAVPLCGTCSSNLTVILRLMAATDGGLPWEVRREFGNTIRALADRAWSYYIGASA